MMFWRYYIQPALRRPFSDWMAYPLFGIAACWICLIATCFALMLLGLGRSDAGKGWYEFGIGILIISTILDLFPTLGILGRWLFSLPDKALRYFRNL